MPGKVNPVLCESMVQVAAHVIGNDAAITVGGLDGHFELIVMMPMMAHNLLESISILTGVIGSFVDGCLQELAADEAKCAKSVENSLMNVTPLKDLVGYDKAAEVAKQAHKSGKSIRETALEMNLATPEQLEKALDPRSMTEPGMAK